MAKRDLYRQDASHDAFLELNSFLLKTAPQTTRKKNSQEKYISVTEALKRERVVKGDTSRDTLRVLFISQDTSLLNPTTQSLDGFLNLSDLFAEVHILILRAGIKAKNPVLRVADNVWMYTATAPVWWLTPRAGKALVEEQLVFASGFRPDLIVARDPFESALTALSLAQQFERPTQLHVLEDYSLREFIHRAPNNFWRRFLPRYTVKKFLSVRTATGTIEQLLRRRFTIPDLAVLPRYQNYAALAAQKSTLDLKAIYKPILFFILYIGKLGHDSTLYRAIDAARFALHNQRVGMVVLGDGVAKAEFQKRAKILGIEKQVIFKTDVKDVVPYFKAANLLIVTDTNADADDTILKAAAAGIPMVMARTERREDLFEHGVSAYVCEETDIQAYVDCINELLNNINLRKILSQNAQRVMEERFHQTLKQYQGSFRASIEQALFVEDDETHLKEDSAAVHML